MNSRYQGPIIDAHHHLWDLSLGRHPWLTSDDGAIKALGDISYLRRKKILRFVSLDRDHDVHSLRIDERST